MNSHLNIVTPAIEFINYRSTEKLLNLLKYLSNPECKLSESIINQLKKTANEPIIADTESFFLFDKKLWSAINNLNFETVWINLLIDENSHTETVSVPLSQEAREVISNYLSSWNKLEDKKLEIIKKFSQPLLFFGVINAKLFEEKSFVPFLEESKNLGQLLSGFILKEDKKKTTYTPYLHDGAWEWIIPNICMAYSALLAEIDTAIKDPESDHTNILKKASGESIALFSILFLLWVSIEDVKDKTTIDKSCDVFFNSLTYIKKEILNLLSASCIAKKAQTVEHLIEQIEFKLTVLSEVLFATDSHEHLRPETYDFIFKAILSEQWEIEGNNTIEELMTFTLNVVLASWLLSRKKLDIFVEDIKSDEVKEHIRKHYVPGPSIETLLYLIEGYDLKLGEIQDLHDAIASHIVNSVNSEFNDSGFARKLNLVEPHDLSTNSFFICGHPKYWESISTLALNMVSDHPTQSAFEDFHKDYYVTDRLIAGANAIFNAGYIDYSLIFLGYGLLHGPLNEPRLYEHFSAKQINSFISKPEVWPRVEKCFLPFLIIILDLDKNILSLENKLWIESIKKRFQSADIRIMPSINVVEPRKSIELKIPPWFKEEEIKESLGGIAKTIRQDLNNETKWIDIAHKSGLKSKLRDIAVSLESSIKEVFDPIYKEFTTNEEFKCSLNSLFNQPLYDKETNIGWFGFLISNLQKNGEKTSKEYESLLSISNKINPEIETLIRNICSLPKTAIDNFYRYKKMRNGLVHSTTVPSPLDSEWLFYYAISGFNEIFQLNHR